MYKQVLLPLLAVLFTASSLFAQDNFEGKVTYDIEYSGEQAEQMRSMMNQMTFIFGDERLRIKMAGGMAAMMGDVLILGKENATYMLQPSTKTAMKIVMDESQQEEPAKPTVTKLDETEEILGYDTRKYKVVQETSSGKLVQYMWITDELKVNPPKNTNGTPGSVNMAVEGIDGFPLKIVTDVNSGGMNVQTTFLASDLSEEDLSDDLFTVPDDYTVKEINPAQLMGGGR